MTRPLSEPSIYKDVGRGVWRLNQLERRPIPETPGLAIYEIKVFEDNVLVKAGDDKFVWEIPEDLDLAEIIKVEGFLSTAGTGATIVQIRHSDPCDDGPNVLSTPVTIEAGDCNSKDAGTQPVVSGGAVTVAWGDHLHIDVDSAGAGAKGLGIIVTLTPSPLGSVALRGLKGDPGGVTSFQGQWQTGTVYNAGDIVTNNSVTYLVTEDHTSDAASEPGTGVDWEDFLTELIDLPDLSSAFEVVLNGNEYPIDIGVQAYMEVPYDCTITRATLLANIAGSIVIDIWRDTYGAFQPTDADSITSATPPTISSGIKNQDTALTGWSTSLTEGDILAFNVDSCSAISKATLSLKVERPV